ncbi:MAG TPA: hypothetical protein VG346_09915 [Acidimicrobiales bacterium]|jgi:hypothetical protein|nr:hypothetical protein [Acidimicrobiales bacterium]
MMAAGSAPTMAAALEEHLRASRLPPDAGNSEPFAVVKVGPMPYPIPNTRARQRAVRIHDLNHLVSGYHTDREGELEISAWELASGGCGRYGAAWVLDLAGLLSGFFVCPGRTVRAFIRGRRQQNLYPYAPDALLAMDVDRARALTAVPPAGALARLPAVLHLGLLSLAAVPVAAAMSLLWWVFYPAWLFTRRTRHSG